MHDELRSPEAVETEETDQRWSESGEPMCRNVACCYPAQEPGERCSVCDSEFWGDDR